MDYNTQREKLIMPEYGRHVQKMIEQVKGIEDRDKRNAQVGAVVQVMTLLNPHLRDYPDYKRKLWDHVMAIADYQLDIDAPYPLTTKEEAQTKPDPLPVDKTPIKASCYGRNIESMIALIADCENEEVRREMIRSLAIYMRQQYLIWNKDNVAERTIFDDMEKLSGGKLKVPEGITLGPVSGDFSRPGMMMNGGQQQRSHGKKNRKRNRNNK
ncbi:MAG: DUF4290 domain-containing protein [Bacteroidales bacterium]|nr:DUF4290 domain-containing protein [Bacteroidales bacterium]